YSPGAARLAPGVRAGGGADDSVIAELLVELLAKLLAELLPKLLCADRNRGPLRKPDRRFRSAISVHGSDTFLLTCSQARGHFHDPAIRRGACLRVCTWVWTGRGGFVRLHRQYPAGRHASLSWGPARSGRRPRRRR